MPTISDCSRDLCQEMIVNRRYFMKSTLDNTELLRSLPNLAETLDFVNSDNDNRFPICLRLSTQFPLRLALFQSYPAAKLYKFELLCT